MFVAPARPHRRIRQSLTGLDFIHLVDLEWWLVAMCGRICCWTRRCIQTFPTTSTKCEIARCSSSRLLGCNHFACWPRGSFLSCTNRRTIIVNSNMHQAAFYRNHQITSKEYQGPTAYKKLTKQARMIPGNRFALDHFYAGTILVINPLMKRTVTPVQSMPFMTNVMFSGLPLFIPSWAARGSSASQSFWPIH